MSLSVTVTGMVSLPDDGAVTDLLDVLVTDLVAVSLLVTASECVKTVVVVGVTMTVMCQFGN